MAMVVDYFVTNFPLLCVAVVMVLVSWQNIKTRRKLSVCFLSIVAMTLVLSILVSLSAYFEQHNETLFGATFSAALGYIIRPFCLFVFVLLIERNLTTKRMWLYMIPLFLNAVVYLFPLFINVSGLRTLVFWFDADVSATNPSMTFHRGPLNFTAHIISALYLAYLVIRSFTGLRGKHRFDSIPVLICSAFIVAAVVMEMEIPKAMGVLNNAIAISCVFDYLFLLDQANRRDALTGLFDRKTYYADVEKYGRAIAGVIQLDMNGLKVINDTKGHQAGDEALVKLARIFSDNMARNQYLYRIGGDEFVILQIGGSQADLDATVEKIRAGLAENGLYCSIGTAYDPSASPADLNKIAEKIMYEDKERFYSQYPAFERRKR